MAERRPIALLDFAIAASLAVVPVMLGMLWLVAVVRPADPAAAARQRVGRPLRQRAPRRRAADLRGGDRAARRPVRIRRAMPANCSPASRRAGANGSAARAVSSACCRRSARRRRPRRRPTRSSRAWRRSMRRCCASAPAPTRASANRSASTARAGSPRSTSAFAASGRVGRRTPSSASRCAAPTSSAPWPRCARSDARMLESLAWRGTEGRTVLAHWRPDQQVAVGARQVMRRNPWGGIAGCIYLGHAEAAMRTAVPSPLRRRGAQRGAASCARCRRCSARRSRATRRTRWTASRGPPTRSTTRAGWCRRRSARCCSRSRGCASRRVRSTSAMPPHPTLDEAPHLMPAVERRANRVVVDGAAVEIGLSVELTIDPALQALAQKTAACYTGRHDVCRALGMRRQEDQDAPLGHRLLEGAMVRMAAVAVIDVASGRIEALAGALSPCARQEVDGPGRDAALRSAPAVSGAVPRRCAAQPGRLPRRDAGVDDQADHGRGVPVRSGGRRALAGGRAAAHAARRRAARRQPARAADALRLGALPRPHVLPRQGLRRLPARLGRAGGRAGVRLERRLRRGARRLRQARPAVRPRARCRRGPMRPARRRCRSPTAG